MCERTFFEFPAHSFILDVIRGKLRTVRPVSISIEERI